MERNYYSKLGGNGESECIRKIERYILDMHLQGVLGKQGDLRSPHSKNFFQIVYSLESCEKRACCVFELEHE